MAQSPDHDRAAAPRIAALVGLALLAYGASALVFGGHGFETAPAEGKEWLGLEGNGWTNVVFVAAGAMLLFAAPVTVLLVSAALCAASALAASSSGAVGIWVANGPTALAWGLASVILLASLGRAAWRRRAAPAVHAHTGTEAPRHAGKRVIHFGVQNVNVDEPGSWRQAPGSVSPAGASGEATQEPPG